MRCWHSTCAWMGGEGSQRKAAERRHARCCAAPRAAVGRCRPHPQALRGATHAHAAALERAELLEAQLHGVEPRRAGRPMQELDELLRAAQRRVVPANRFGALFIRAAVAGGAASAGELDGEAAALCLMPRRG